MEWVYTQWVYTHLLSKWVYTHPMGNVAYAYDSKDVSLDQNFIVGFS